MNKFIKIFGLVLAFATVLCFVGCKEEGDYEEVGTTGSESQTNIEFIYNGKSVSIGEKWTSAKDKLGEFNSTFVAESCAYQGTDRYYYFEDFEVMTSEIDGVELLTDIFIEKENVVAVNDVCVGMSLADMAMKMGPADKTTENNYIYYGNKVNVQINTRDNKVISIEYYYVQE